MVFPCHANTGDPAAESLVFTAVRNPTLSLSEPHNTWSEYVHKKGPPLPPTQKLKPDEREVYVHPDNLHKWALQQQLAYGGSVRDSFPVGKKAKPKNAIQDLPRDWATPAANENIVPIQVNDAGSLRRTGNRR